MHIALPILDGHLLMGTDITESMSTDKLVVGNNIYITLEPESEKETERLFNSLSKNGNIELALKSSAWNSLHGVCQDPFGIGWILDFPYPS